MKHMFPVKEEKIPVVKEKVRDKEHMFHVVKHMFLDANILIDEKIAFSDGAVH